MASFVLYQALDRLAGALQRAGSPIRDLLRPGRPDGEVREALRALDLVAPFQLIDLYAWADGIGVGPDGAPDLVWAARFLSLAEATAEYRSVRTLAGTGREVEPREWFPVFATAEGAQVSVQCGLGAGRGTVWWSPPAVPIFDSLAEGVDAARWCVETGRWDVDPAGRITCEDGRLPGDRRRADPR